MAVIYQAGLQRLKRGGPLLTGMLFALFLGLAVGLAAPQRMDAETLAHTRAAIGSYIQALPEADISPHAECGRALLLNGALIVFIGLSGLSLLGLPLSAAILFAKGLSLGYAMSFLLDYQDISGFVVIFLSLLPPNLLLIPLFVLSASLAATFSLSLFRTQAELGQRLRIYGLRFTAVLALTALAAFVQGYICPLLLTLFFVVI